MTVYSGKISSYLIIKKGDDASKVTTIGDDVEVEKV